MKRLTGVGDQLEFVPVSELSLDHRNPRLPVDMQNPDQDQLRRYIDEAYDPLSIARSIADFGYFTSEPLIAVNIEGSLVVVEGNRRLVALQGLAYPDVRASFNDAAEWDELAERAEVTAEDRVPVIVAELPEQVAPIIGYRHISGIAPWEPFAKARFIAHLIDGPNGEAQTFEEVADLVGESVPDIRAHYRNHGIAKQARDDFEIETEPMESEFGVFTRAMTSRPLREFIRAPEPRHVEQGPEQVPAHEAADLGDLLTWLFGNIEGAGRVISESRDITRLGTVVESPTGLDVLRNTGDLDSSFEAAGGVLTRLTNRLSSARNTLRAAAEDIDTYADEETVVLLVGECEDALQELTQAISIDGD